ncbi:hypothetical protein T440DRAFT_466068 [Plenodomus tracheiphilus IPT5]|uniref:Uncharacterized protein n=1 Tax=Plenodomus tracheiphilus IPT5 TaxID=1408161 RepID=A0A6A7BCT1_9PLEO|nr:hypothetical protein T440DRAFT_466068 [Plenodomus tracheiphilus IPT5]
MNSSEQGKVAVAHLELARIDTYLQQLPRALLRTPTPGLHLGGENLTAWCEQVLGPIYPVVAEIVDSGCTCDEDGCPCDILRKNEEFKMGLIALNAIRIARDRLDAYLQGDSHRYKTACLAEMFTLAESEVLVQYFVLRDDFAYWNEDVQENDMYFDEAGERRSVWAWYIRYVDGGRVTARPRLVQFLHLYSL